MSLTKEACFAMLLGGIAGYVISLIIKACV